MWAYGFKPIHQRRYTALAVYHNFGLKVDPVLLLSQGTGPTFTICCGRRIWLFIGIPVRRHDWSDKFSKMFSSERDFSILLLMISSVLKRMMASCRGRAQDRGFIETSISWGLVTRRRSQTQWHGGTRHYMQRAKNYMIYIYIQYNIIYIYILYDIYIILYNNNHHHHHKKTSIYNYIIYIYICIHRYPYLN